MRPWDALLVRVTGQGPGRHRRCHPGNLRVAGAAGTPVLGMDTWLVELLLTRGDEPGVMKLLLLKSWWNVGKHGSCELKKPPGLPVHCETLPSARGNSI